MKLHLIILAGIDNRGPYVRDTVRLSQSYFDAIHVIDTGSTDDTRLAVPAVIDLKHWKDNWALAYQTAADQVSFGDCFLFLDSDERPSQLLLDNIGLDCDQMIASGHNMGQIPNVLHLDGRIAEGPSANAVIGTFPVNHTQFQQNSCWTKSILVRKLPGLTTSTNGAHAGFVQQDYRTRYFPHYYNHYKTSSQISQSTVLCSWSKLDAYSVTPGSVDWLEHERLKKEYHILTASDLMKAVADNHVPQEMIDTWTNWGLSAHPTLREFYKWAILNRFGKELHQSVCGSCCCKYKDEQL